jgi:DNA-binding MarR family transcriptional regulator
MASRLGISGPQRLVLRAVGRGPGISAGALAEMLHLDPSTLTGHIQKMELDGLLERRLAPDDARRAALYLTPKGRRLDVTTPGTIEEAVDGILTSEPADAVEHTQRVLRRLANALHERAEAVPERKRTSTAKPPAKPKKKAKSKR